MNIENKNSLDHRREPWHRPGTRRRGAQDEERRGFMRERAAHSSILISALRP